MFVMQTILNHVELFLICRWCEQLTKAVEQKTHSGNLLKMHQEPVPVTSDQTAVNDETSEEPEIESKEYVIWFFLNLTHISF